MRGRGRRAARITAGRRIAARLAGVALLVAACSGGNDPDGSTSLAATTTTRPAVEAASWPTAGRDLENTRAVLDSSISSETIADATELWRTPLPEAGTLSTTPLVVDGTVHLQGSTGQVVAVDAASGEIAWTGEPTGFNIGPFGVAVDDERVYALDGSEGVVALDRADGAEIWSTDVTTTPTLGIDIQPVVVDDLVIVSSVPVSVGGIYTPGDRGVIHALDAASGDVRWSFDTVWGDDLWGAPDVNSGGGAWYPPAVDQERGLVYVGVANPAPFPGTPEWPNGSSRPGPNLYTNSLVALDLATGELAWYHQVVPHDLFDRDQVHALIAAVDGEDVVISAGKSGVLVGLDPTTARCGGGRRSASTATTTSRRSTVRPRWRPGRTAVCSRLPPPRTASSTPRSSTPPRRWRPTRRPTSAPRWARPTARSSRSTPTTAPSCGRCPCPAIPSAAPLWSATWW
jgi:alcohol dehydrogenase (cytochrome c)